MAVLLVEDDEFKAADITKVIVEFCESTIIRRAMSVTTALRAVSETQFSLVVLDMSLPTFELSGPGGGGSPQSQGGLEVLRLAKRLSAAQGAFVLITQYPDIELEGRDVPLAASLRIIKSKFELDVRDCILYEFDTDAWRQPLRSVLSSVSEKWGGL